MGEPSSEVGGFHDAGAAARGYKITLLGEELGGADGVLVPRVGAEGAVTSHNAYTAAVGHAVGVVLEEVTDGVVDGMVVHALIEGFVDVGVVTAVVEMGVDLEVAALIEGGVEAGEEFLPGVEAAAVGVVGEAGVAGVDEGSFAAEVGLLCLFKCAAQKGGVVNLEPYPIDWMLEEVDAYDGAIAEVLAQLQESVEGFDATNGTFVLALKLGHGLNLR